MPIYGTTPDATTSTKGKIQLAGDLGGTAAAPTVAYSVRSAQTAQVATSQTTTSTSYTDLATGGPAVTVTTGTQALVSIYCGTIQNDTGTDYALASFAVSGATTIAASDTYCLKMRNATAILVGDWGFGATWLITGLTPGSNTFTMKYRAAVGGTAIYAVRQITVVP